jgi:aldose 1-epimerase
VWTETRDHLSDRYLPIASHAQWSFSEAPLLPDHWLNNAFTGWGGEATIEWPERGLGATITAAEPLRTLILYSPSAEAPYISVEPVSHSVDAHNRDATGAAPPQRLAPGERLTLAVRIAPTEL